MRNNLLHHGSGTGTTIVVFKSIQDIKNRSPMRDNVSSLHHSFVHSIALFIPQNIPTRLYAAQHAIAITTTAAPTDTS